VRFALAQNYPNPFNPATTIRYALPKAERVTLKIYDLLGKEVMTLIDREQKAAGDHVIFWDGRNQDGRLVASGIYLYQLHAGNFTLTKKMALTR
jgi:flagellar hook assembly protein FlgD